MIKREASFQTRFNHWLRESFKKTGVFELKHDRNGGITFHFPGSEASSDTIPEDSEARLFSYKISELRHDGIQAIPDCFCLAGVSRLRGRQVRRFLLPNRR